MAMPGGVVSAARVSPPIRLPALKIAKIAWTMIIQNEKATKTITPIERIWSSPWPFNAPSTARHVSGSWPSRRRLAS